MAHESPTIIYWISNAIELLQRVCVVVIVAYISMRFTPVRRALSGAQTSWQNQVFTAIFFGLLAILGTHLGLIFNTDIQKWEWATRVKWPLEPHEAIIGLRDLMVLVAGIFGGIWIGLGAGLLAGFERYLLQGDVGDVSALATVILGLGAGLFRCFKPRWTISVKGILTISVLGTTLQKVMLSLSPLLSRVPTDHAATLLVWETTVPVFIANCLGCLLVLLVMKDLENDKIIISEQSAQLRALHAQVEPHFLNNMLTAIQDLIQENPKSAFNYVSKLAQFFNLTRKVACANSIKLADELKHLQLYLDFQALRFPGKFFYHEDIPESLLQCHIAPRSLQTLVENIFVHARHGKKGQIKIELKGEDLTESNTMRLKVNDTGCGMTQERADILGTKEVLSVSKYGSGSALYQISRSLALVFNNKASIKVESQLGESTSVILNIPKRSEAW